MSSVYDEFTKTEKEEMKTYFKPKKIEFYRNQTIYEFFGIKLFKKYLPMTGDIARKRRKIIQIKLNKSERINELYRYERETRNNELRHIIATIGLIGLIFITGKKLSYLDLVFLTALNLYFNIYPIFLQRHNRIRIIKVLLNNGQKSPYDEQGSRQQGIAKMGQKEVVEVLCQYDYSYPAASDELCRTTGFYQKTLIRPGERQTTHRSLVAEQINMG